MRFAVPMVMTSMLALAGPVHAADDQVLRGPVPDWVVSAEPMAVPEDASGLVFVRRGNFHVHLDDQGQALHNSYRIRILHPNALQMGNLSLAWKPSAGAPTVHTIRVHRGDEVIDVLENATFEILRREDQLEAASLDGILTAIMRVPDLRVGDELEVAMTIRANDPTLRSTVAGILLLAPEPPPGRFRLGLSWEEGQEPNLRMTPDMAAVARRGARTLELRFDHPATLVAPNNAPPRYFWQRIIEYSDFSDWEAISRHFAPLYSQAATLDPASPLRAEVRRIAAAHADPLDRARAALRLVQQEVRYIYVGLDGANLTPAAADETWRRRYGDCKGKTALLLALLAELGIDARAVLVNNAGADDGLDERLPNPGLFNHVLVRAEIGDTGYWLDGTLPPVAEPSVDPVLPYRWTLPLTAQGSSIQRQAWRPAERPDEVTLVEIDARAGFDEPARITQTTIVRGLAGLQQQVELSGLTAAQLLSSFQQHGIGDTWQVIDEARWRYDARAQASILTIVGSGTVDWSSRAGEGKSLTLPGGGFNPPPRRVRPVEQDQDAPYYNAPSYHCHVTTVRLPESTQASHWSFNTSFDTRIFGRNHYRAFELRDGAIRMVRGSRIERQEIAAADAQRDNARIAAFDNSMASITYDPTRNATRSAWGRRVPATDEIDWTADRVPCLSADTVR